MNYRIGLGAALAAVVALAGGWWAGAVPGLIVGGLVGIAAAYAIWSLGVRTVVAVPVVAGTFLGAVIGRAILRAICLPDSCVAFEVFGAVGTAVGAFVGVGLVVALVVRSFDEYRGNATGPAGPGEEAESDDQLPGPTQEA
jgi:hypothetical protein